MSSEEIQYFFENPPFFEALFKDLAAARYTILIEMYKIDADAVGERLHAVLLKKADAGVRIQIIVDGIGSRGLTKEYVDSLNKHPNIQWRTFRPLKFVYPLKEYLNKRDHRKMVIIDSQVGYLGSGNIAMNDWRDTQVRLTGPLLGKMVYFYMRLLRDVKYRSTRFERFSTENDVVVTRNFLGRNHIRRYIHRYLRRSQKLVTITTAYFVPDVETIFHLRRAIRRGVEVKVITNCTEHCDVPVVNSVNRPILRYLIKRGIKIYFFNERMMHAKTVVFDDKIATVGSSNINYRSFFRDLEINLFIRDPKWIDPLKKQFELDLAKCRPVSLKDLHVPWYQRLLDTFFYLLRSFF